MDGPGDDTPRLVSADRLDHRADPRGTYLRAEAGWAKPWRSGERPADRHELRGIFKLPRPGRRCHRLPTREVVV